MKIPTLNKVQYIISVKLTSLSYFIPLFVAAILSYVIFYIIFRLIISYLESRFKAFEIILTNRLHTELNLWIKLPK